jgi:prevent-host-death family protein
MTKVGVCEAKRRLEELVDEVLRGRDIVITRWGKPIARIERYAATRRVAGPRRAKRRQTTQGPSTYDRC